MPSKAINASSTSVNTSNALPGFFPTALFFSRKFSLNGGTFVCLYSSSLLGDKSHSTFGTNNVLHCLGICHAFYGLEMLHKTLL